MKFVTLTLIMEFYSLSTCLGQRDDTNVTTSVSRRCFQDIYRKMNSSHTVCPKDQPTYMVEEQRCIENDDLLNRCRFALSDSRCGTSNTTLFMHFRENSVTNVAIIDVNQQNNKSLNITLCQIASLKVYRGRESVTEISHSGFTLTDGSTIQVDDQQLAYSSSDYSGELFHMKLTCPHSQAEGHTQNECLFFKVGGNTSVAGSKFNCTVPGTLSDYSADYRSNQTTFSSTKVAQTTTSNSTLTTTAIATKLTVLNEKQPSKFEVGSRLFYIVVGAGGGMVMLLICCVCCACIVLICRRKGIKVSGITSSEMERRISTASRQIETKNDKETELDLYVHMYAAPSEVIRSNTMSYGCNCLDDNPAYPKPGVSTEKFHESEMNRCKLEEMLECSYAIIPPEKSLDHGHDGNKEEPLYQEILPKAELTSSLPRRPKEIPHSARTVDTAENDFYQTSLDLHQLQQWKEGCYSNVPSGHHKLFQTFHHFQK